MTMKCGSVRRNLSALLDDELEQAVAEAVREHLRTCEACAAALEAVRAADADAGEALRGVAESAHPSGAFTARVLGTIAAGESRGTIVRRSRLRVLAFGAAAAVLLAVGLWGLLRSRPPVQVVSQDDVAPTEDRASGVVMTSLDLPSVRELVNELLGAPGDPGGREEREGPQLNHN